MLKVACSGPGVSRTRSLSVTSPIVYHLDHCTPLTYLVVDCCQVVRSNDAITILINHRERLEQQQQQRSIGCSGHSGMYMCVRLRNLLTTEYIRQPCLSLSHSSHIPSIVITLTTCITRPSFLRFPSIIHIFAARCYASAAHAVMRCLSVYLSV